MQAILNLHVTICVRRRAVLPPTECVGKLMAKPALALCYNRDGGVHVKILPTPHGLQKLLFGHQNSGFSKSVFAKRNEPNIGLLPTPGSPDTDARESLATDPRAESKNLFSRNEPGNPHKTNETTPAEPENEPTSARNLSHRPPPATLSLYVSPLRRPASSPSSSGDQCAAGPGLIRFCKLNERMPAALPAGFFLAPCPAAVRRHSLKRHSK